MKIPYFIIRSFVSAPMASFYFCIEKYIINNVLLLKYFDKWAKYIKLLINNLVLDLKISFRALRDKNG